MVEDVKMTENNNQEPPSLSSDRPIKRRDLLKTILLGGAGAVAADASTSGNRHSDSVGMRVLGAAVGGASLIALERVANKSGKDDIGR